MSGYGNSRHARRGLPPPHRKFQLGEKIPGTCRFCREEIRHPRTNAILTRKTWHPECVPLYKEQAWNKDLRKAIWIRDGGVCRECGVESSDWQADHIIPLKLGGSFSHDNIQTLCPPCHKKKTKLDNQAIRKTVQ